MVVDAGEDDLDRSEETEGRQSGDDPSPRGRFCAGDLCGQGREDREHQDHDEDLDRLSGAATTADLEAGRDRGQFDDDGVDPAEPVRLSVRDGEVVYVRE